MSPRLHSQALAEALRRMASQPVATATFILVLGLALAIPLVAALLLRSVSAAVAHLDTDPVVNVYLVPDAADEDAKRVEQGLRASPEAAEVRFVSKAQALAELKGTTHLAEVLATLDRNPLPHAFTVRVRSAEPAKLAQIKAAWLQLPKVDQVVADFEWGQRLARWVQFGERVVYAAENVDMVVAPGSEGQLGILPRHAALFTLLAAGEMRVKQGATEQSLVVFGGFLEVANNRVLVLADSAERVEEIDVSRAEEARRRAQSRIVDRSVHWDVERAQLALQRSSVRLRIAGRQRGRRSDIPGRTEVSP